MDIRVHNIVSVTEDINYYDSPGLKFVTRTLIITDADGNEHSLTMFSDSIEKLTTSKRTEYEYA